MLNLLLSLLLTKDIAAFAPMMLHSVVETKQFMQESPLDPMRRSWLINAVTMASSAALLPNAALAEETFQTYQNPVCGFQIKIPANWEKSTQQLPDRRSITLFVDPASGQEKTLFFLAKTPVRDDFTSLGSFGSVDRVAQSVILPQGEVGGANIPSELISAESSKNAYFFDYKVTPPGQEETHYRAIFALANGATGGAGSILVTLTIQTPESRYAEMKPIFDQMVESYGKYTADA